MKDLKKLLNKELDCRVPRMSDKLKAYPVANKIQPKNNLLKIIIPTGLGLALASALVVTVLLAKPSGDIVIDNNMMYYVVEINPTILIEADNNGVINSVKSGNSDADSFIIDLNLNGMNINEGVKKIANDAMRLGYIKPDNSNKLRVSGENTTIDNLNEIKKSFLEEFCSEGYYVAILTEELDLDYFNNKYNEAISSFSTYFDDLKDLSYMNKEINKDNLDKQYFDDYLVSYLFNTINLHLDNLKSCKELINEIKLQYDRFYRLAIPSLSKDYWYLANNYYVNKEIPEDIKLELDKMAELLASYQAINGKDINSYLSIMVELNKLNSIDIEILESLVKSVDNLVSYITNELNDGLNNLINLISIILPELEGRVQALIQMPNTIDEYYNNLNIMMECIKDDMIKRNSLIYNDIKESINKSSYLDYMDSIINEFGSIENYFK